MFVFCTFLVDLIPSFLTFFCEASFKINVNTLRFLCYKRYKVSFCNILFQFIIKIGSVIQITFKYVSDESKEAGTWQILKVEVKKSEEPTQPDNSSGTEDYDKPGWDWNK